MHSYSKIATVNVNLSAIKLMDNLNDNVKLAGKLIILMVDSQKCSVFAEAEPDSRMLFLSREIMLKEE